MLLPACNKDDIVTDDGGKTEGAGTFRPATAESKPECDKVYEWTPAPGQFINETAGGGGNLATAEMAAAWAQGRLDKGAYVSLGGFGGYIVVGFDHSIMSTRGHYDFAIAGNAFYNASSTSGGSSEPGIVYVMQDANGNGMPDDVWYELKGSEYANSATIADYEVTYFRPAKPGMDVEWTDNRGGRGTIDYQASFHKQDCYYPSWIGADSYTLKGVCLESRNAVNPDTGLWENNAYGWGYADNMGDDCTAIGKYSQCNRFRISDAVDADGQPADLQYIDFVKVQTGINAKSGVLGELSTEVFGIFDLNL